MSNPYVFDTEMSRTRKINEPLSPVVRAAIYPSVVADGKKANITRHFNIDRSTVYDTIKRFPERHNFESRHIPGCSRSSDAHDERHLV